MTTEVQSYFLPAATRVNELTMEKQGLSERTTHAYHISNVLLKVHLAFYQRKLDTHQS
jgi:hypothetical protein